MVYRQLQLASLALGLVLGCQAGDPGRVSIALQLDAQSCGAIADNLQLLCGGTLWIHVAASDGSVIDNACVDLGPGSVNFSELGPILDAGIDLGTLPGQTPLRISLGVYSESLSPCPTQEVNISPIIFGDTAVVVLSEANEPVSLALSCLAPVLPPTPADDPTCDLCNQELAMCLASVGASSCESVLQSCQQNCADGGACELCGLLGQRCQQAGLLVTLNCQGLGDECVDSCQNDIQFCEGQCAQIDFQCNQTAMAIAACEQATGDCPPNCDLDPSSSCLALR